EEEYDEGYDVAIDSFGNVYGVGYSKSCSQLVKYDRKGNFILNRTWRPSGKNVRGKGIKLDSSNNIYIGGDGAGGMFLLKYNFNCELQWARIWGGPKAETFYDMAIDSYDNIYLAGATKSFSEGGDDLCIVKYDSNGNQIWNRTWGGSDYDQARSIAIDSLEGFNMEMQ
ncbi:MAG: hypothetical protein P8Y23_18850, partial [Candidatus Lokiarchaeota archaeon]